LKEDASEPWLDFPTGLEPAVRGLAEERRRRPYGSPLEEDLLAAQFGFEKFALPSHGLRERPVNVVFHHFHDGASIQQGQDAVAP
jgi:hypothetical protein